MIQKLSDTVELNNGIKIPGLGLGVFQISDQETAEVVKNGIVNGYRLIDTAQIYGNEKGTGAGIKAGLAATGLKREDLFVTSKVWNARLTYEETKQSFVESLEKLQLDYLDLFLIHWPGKDAYKESWLALEDLYAEGKIKAIGVSNFEISHLKNLLSFAKVVPVINQIELHPKLAQTELRDFAAENKIKIQAWSPLMQGQLLDHPLIVELAQKYGQSPAQIILRWDVQQEILLVVKSIHQERMKNNAAIFDFNIELEDIEKLNQLDEGLRSGPDPMTFDF
ncbi:aldo/keto reductase [Enterococcus sp. ALS3]|uniref:Aldo/keto reductase n=1 Tax=Enterococcus alishanensis TaxID=1303817 RepID=A0ABS6TGC9_9ENTE|nr:aldo/keto reductase [Enterococcus alishanensis]MBV7391869.1 aldo/keto reductase [Enterococcus alishanensis]